MAAPQPQRVKLSTPIVVDGDTIKEVTLTEPTGKGLREITRAFNRMERDDVEFTSVDVGMVQLRAMSGLTEEALDGLSMTDVRTLMTHVPALMGMDPNAPEES